MLANKKVLVYNRSNENKYLERYKGGRGYMKFKRIRTKMLMTLLPVIIIAMAVLTTISAVSSAGIMNEQISETMEATLEAEAGTIEDYLNVVQSMAMTISRTV